MHAELVTSRSKSNTSAHQPGPVEESEPSQTSVSVGDSDVSLAMSLGKNAFIF